MKHTIKDLPSGYGKRVIVRVDYNVPLRDLKVEDDFRIRLSLDTIRFLLDKGYKVVLISHLGRPKGKVVDSLKMDPVAKRLAKLLDESVLKLDDCVGPDIEKQVNETDYRVILLENLRFHKEEEENDLEFAKSLSKLADFYVNDAFGTSHRKHASTYGIVEFLPSYLGFLIEKELDMLSKVLNPEKPFSVILGGAKVSDKIKVLKNLIPKADSVLIGGAMAFTFYKALGKEIGKSKVEDDKLQLAKELIELAKSENTNLILPKDFVCVKEIKEDAEFYMKNIDDFDKLDIGVDIGDESVKEFKPILTNSKTVFWNGPMGIFEIKPFDKGTYEVAKLLANSDALSIIGGGDSVAAIRELGLQKAVGHLSSGGGASLKFVAGDKLPAIDVILNK